MIREIFELSPDGYRGDLMIRQLLKPYGRANIFDSFLT